MEVKIPGATFGPISLAKGSIASFNIMGVDITIPPYPIIFLPKITLWKESVIFNTDWLVKPIADAFFSVGLRRNEMIPEIEHELIVKSLKPEDFKTKEFQEMVKRLREAWQHSPAKAVDLSKNILQESLGGVYEGLIKFLLPEKARTFEEAKTQAFWILFIGFDVTLFIGIVDTVACMATCTLIRNFVHIARLYVSTFGLDSLVRSTVYPAMDAGLVRPLTQGWNAQYQSQIPGSQDMIRMMVREVFTPDVREKYGQDQDYPTEADRLLAMHGFSREWARNYWAAHWELPSAGQGFEMFHREKINLDDLKTLLRTLDIMPFWRDKLIDIAYNLIPRLDLRRGWELGMIPTEELERRYRWLGFSPDDAVVMSAISRREALESEINRLQKAAENRYKDGYITRDQAEAEIRALGWAPEKVQLLLQILDVEAEYDLLKETEKLLETEYVKDVISTSEEYERFLKSLVVRDEIRNLKIALADLKKYKKPSTTLSVKVGE
jgi:hypothetical protein